MIKVYEINIDNFSNMMGCNPCNLSHEIKMYFKNKRLQYTVIESDRHTEYVNAITDELNKNLVKTGKHRLIEWEKGWQENLHAFKRSSYNTDALHPKYYQSKNPLRLNGMLIRPISDEFEWQFSEIYRKYLFATYFEEVDNIYEFGCGAGYSLSMLAEMFPRKNLFGYDWAKSSLDILKLMRQHKSYSIQGAQFDFFKPDKLLTFDGNAAVFTYHALEQVGKDFRPFIDFIIKRSPTVVVNVECIFELYNSDNQFDNLAIKYHKKRNYLIGYYNYLLELESKGEISILSCIRTKFGSFYHEAYSHIVWKIN